MPAILLWIVKNPVTTALIVVVIAVTGYAGVLQVERFSIQKQLGAAQVENVQLVQEKAALKASVDTLNVQIDLTKKAQDALVSTLTDLSTKAANDAALQKDIDNAPASDDAPIAPVLRRALNGGK